MENVLKLVSKVMNTPIAVRNCKAINDNIISLPVKAVEVEGFVRCLLRDPTMEGMACLQTVKPEAQAVFTNN